MGNTEFGEEVSSILLIYKEKNNSSLFVGFLVIRLKLRFKLFVSNDVFFNRLRRNEFINIKLR